MRLAEPSGPLIPSSIALGATESCCLLLSASCTGVRPFQGGALAAPRLQAPKQHLQVCEAASLQFIKGVNESTVPDVSLRRSRTGTSGQAMFTFENPSIFQASSELGDITGRHVRHRSTTCCLWNTRTPGCCRLQQKQQRSPEALLSCRRPRAGLFMIDDEGTLSTTDVKARFVNGKPTAIEARYNMRSQFEWDRFIRFMDRCGD